jgi:protein CWC15
VKGGPSATAGAIEGGSVKRALENGDVDMEGGEEESPEAKRRRVLEESRDVDADSDGEGSSEEDSDESEDEEDETAELLRELEKIKKERAETREREVCASCLGLCLCVWQSRIALDWDWERHG